MTFGTEKIKKFSDIIQVVPYVKIYINLIYFTYQFSTVEEKSFI